MPRCVGRLQDFDKPLLLRLSPVSFDRLAFCFGRSPKAYERAFVSLAKRTNLVATSCKIDLPQHLLADEKHVTAMPNTEYLCVTVARGCILGANMVAQTTKEAFIDGYATFALEARQAQPDYEPSTVCLDGFKSTNAAWKEHFPKTSIILCFLHSVLKLYEVSSKLDGAHYGELSLIHI